MENNYFLPDNFLGELQKIDKKSEFDVVYSNFKGVFLKSFAKNLNADSFSDDSADTGKRIIPVIGQTSAVYAGKLWADERVRYIGLMDYIFTVPLWDWWIAPVFPREINRKNNMSLIFTENISQKNLSELYQTLKAEKFTPLKSINLDALRLEYEKDVKRIDIMINEIWPLKLANETKRISLFAKEGNFESYYFVLRSGKFIKELLGKDIEDKTVAYFSAENTMKSKINERSLVIDDCIGTSRTLENIIKTTDAKKISFATVDSTLPLEVYQRKFPSITFSIPSSHLNIYCCRLFEENSPIIGIDQRQKSNLVREKLINKIKSNMKINNIEKKIAYALNSIKNF